MTKLYIYNLAHFELLARWAKEHDRLETNPGDTIAAAREPKLWKELKELEALIIKAEKAEKKA